MQQNIRPRHKAILLCALFTIAIGATPAVAQSGSAGGSIGNNEKALSGTRSTPSAKGPARSSSRSRSDDTPQRSAPKRGGGGSSNYDGAWIVVSSGVTCSGGSTTAVIITSGKILGEGVTGTVGSGGSVNAVTNSKGVTIVTTGKLSGRSGSGSFRQSDGCSGSWSAAKK